MNGKKFVIYFVLAIVLTGIGVSLWIKQAYDTRPQVNISEPQTEP